VIALLAAAAFALPVRLEEVHAPYARVRLPAFLDPGPRGDYGDLRVRDDRGREIPYALDPRGDGTALVAIARSDFVVRADDDPNEQRAVLELANANTALEKVRMGSGTEAFARVVRLERSDDGTTWTGVAGGRAERYPDGEAQLEFDAHGERARFWRVSVDDADDLPLAALTVTLYAHEHTIVFPIARGRRYALTFGDPDREAPSYDLSAILRNDRRRAQPASLGPLVKLSSAPAVKPRFPVAPSPPAERRRRIGERLPALAFGIVVCVLGWFALRLLRTAALPEPRG
jgi:hypothetical protein